LLVVLEGIDGTGKSTLARSLAQQLTLLGHDVVLSREPTDGPHGRRLRQSATLGRLSANEELETFIADRREHVSSLILPSLAAGRIVVLDRYYFSTAAYQGSRGLDWRAILDRNEAFAPEPDLLLILEIDPTQSLGRIQGRGDAANEFERLENLQKVDAVFRTLDRPYLRRFDATQSREQLLQSALDAVVTARRHRSTG
jgi:dTMP kinase